MKPVLLIAGGGTGGHVYPGLAIARELVDLADVDVVFVGTSRGLEARVVPAQGFALETLVVAPMKGGGAVRFVEGGVVAAKAVLAARRILSRHRARAILSIGGYAAGPLSLAGALIGIPLALVEPNAVMGFTHRVLTPFSRRVYTAWNGVSAIASRERRYGVPIRRGFAAAPRRSSDEIEVLVLGGSQGAAALNAEVPKALAATPLGARLRVVHQTGPQQVAEVQSRYDALGLRATAVAFIEDSAAAIRDAQLVIARSGASTVAEVAAVGRAAIFIPLPSAADDHQTHNAKRLVTAGGAVLVEQSAIAAGALGRALSRVFCTEGELERLGRAAAQVGRPQAARVIAQDVLELARIAQRDTNDITPADAGAGSPVAERAASGDQFASENRLEML